MEKTDAIDFMTSLLNLQPHKLRSYIQNYMRKEKLAKSISDDLYNKDFKNLKQDFKTELEKAIKTFVKYAQQGGRQIMQALLAGLRKGKNLGGALSAAEKKLEKDLKPKKPKKPKKPVEGVVNAKKPTVRRGMQVGTPLALAAGEARSLIKSAEVAAAKAHSPRLAVPIEPMAGRAERRSDDSKPIQIQTVVKLNGKVVAKELTPLIDVELNKRYRKY